MDDFEKFIRENRADFDGLEVPLGDSSRFGKRLDQSNAHWHQSQTFRWRKIAAAVVILFLAIPASLYFVELKQNGNADYLESKYMSAEQQEAQFYYVSNIKNGIGNLHQMLTDADLPVADKAVLDEVMANFEVRQANILEDLNSSNGDERVVDALLDYYRVKLEVINGIVKRLETLNEGTDETDANFEL